jgi:hypothetical protein
MAAGRHFDPAPRSQIFLPEEQHRDQEASDAMYIQWICSSTA